MPDAFGVTHDGASFTRKVPKRVPPPMDGQCSIDLLSGEVESFGTADQHGRCEWWWFWYPVVPKPIGVSLMGPIWDLSSRAVARGL
ncbi:MAG: hypothetical protein ACYDHP_02970 [Ferrimicrobium sp.]